ncbi:hypothetical protein PE36_18044 [Moritella sp. PE36]|nr:hypothetical protein PE36_18044 [Moritella sp. PE36]
MAIAGYENAAVIAGFTAMLARLVVSAALPAPAVPSSMAEVVEDW